MAWKDKESKRLKILELKENYRDILEKQRW